MRAEFAGEVVFIEEIGIYREELVLIWDSEILLAEWYSLKRIYDVYYEVYLIGIVLSKQQVRILELQEILAKLKRWFLIP